MSKVLNYEVKEKLVSLAGACFWYFDSFYSFLRSCGVQQRHIERYPRESYNKYQTMRQILEDLEIYNHQDTIKNIVAGFYRLRNSVDREKTDNKRAIDLLKEFREIVGNDPIEEEIRKKETKEKREQFRKSIEAHKATTQRLSEIKAKFLSLSSGRDFTPQQRGFEFERLFYELLEFSEFEFTKPYRSDQEQIDGHFRYEKFDYLVEVKWTSGPIKQEEMSIFDGKIRGKAQSTRGLFLSTNGFDDNAIIKYSGESPRIVLMTGEDLILILEGSISLHDAMRAKVDGIVRYGKILVPLRQVIA